MKLNITLMAFLVGMIAYNVALRNNNIQLMNELNCTKQEKLAIESKVAEGLCLERLELSNG